MIKLRHSAGLSLISILAACSGAVADPPPDPDSLIECALDGAEIFARECVLELEANSEYLRLVLHHPDGSFRRLEMTEGPMSLISSDGADKAEVSLTEEIIGIKVTDDRYRLAADRVSYAAE